MAMQVENQLYLLSFGQFLNEVFDDVDFWLFDWVWFEPASIEVEPCEISPIVSQEYSIHVDHRDNVNVESPK